MYILRKIKTLIPIYLYHLFIFNISNFSEVSSFNLPLLVQYGSCHTKQPLTRCAAWHSGFEPDEQFFEHWKSVQH